MAVKNDYISYFGLKEPPFRLSPDPEFFFPARPHLAARQVIGYAIERGEGFMVLTGPAGTGKTLILRLILKDLPDHKVPCLILTPKLDPTGLLRLILEELKRPTDGDQGSLLKGFQEVLLEFASKGKELFIVVDEAQNIPLETLEQLRLLSNLETSRKKLLQILLLGQPELERLLKDKRLGQLAQRITIKETLRPLDKKETQEYVNFRLAQAGRADLSLSWLSLWRLYMATNGIPRRINRLMDRALLMASASGSNRIRTQDISSAIKTLPEGGAAYRGLMVHGAKITSALAAILVAGAIFLFPQGKSTTYSPNGHAMPQKECPLSDQSKHEVQNILSDAKILVPRALIRSGPGRQYPLVAVGYKGQALKVIEKNGQWIRVKVYLSDGKSGTGWIHQDLLKEKKLEIEARAAMGG